MPGLEQGESPAMDSDMATRKSTGKEKEGPTLGPLLPRSARVSIARKSEFCGGGIKALLSGIVVPCRDHCSQNKPQSGRMWFLELGGIEEMSQDAGKGGGGVITIYCRSRRHSGEAQSCVEKMIFTSYKE